MELTPAIGRLSNFLSLEHDISLAQAKVVNALVAVLIVVRAGQHSQDLVVPVATTLMGMGEAFQWSHGKTNRIVSHAIKLQMELLSMEMEKNHD